MESNGSTVPKNLFEVVIRVVYSMANSFSFDCVYFLNSFSSNDVINHTLAKAVFLKLGKLLAFSNFSAYSNYWNRTKEDQCQVPLRVMFHFNETEIGQDFKDHNNFYTDHPKKNRPGAWIIFLKSFEDKFVAEFFRKIYVPFDIEFIVAWIFNKMVHLKEVYQVAPSYPLQQHYFGNWSLKTGFRSPRIFPRHSRRSNLEGLQIKVGYIDKNLPFTMMLPTSHKNYLNGYFGEIWHAVEDLVNISSTYIKIDFKREKEENRNSWLRAIKMLQEKKLDVGLGDFFTSTKRIGQLDFSYPLLTSNFQMFYKNAPSDRLFHGYLLPFGYDIWLTLLLWSIIISLSISCSTLIRKRFIRSKEKALSTSTAFFMTFGGLCGQGSSSCPGFLSMRMLLLFTYIVAGIMIPSYSASLTHYLIDKPLGVTFRTLNDFFETNSHKITVVDGSYEYYIFQNVTKDNEMLEKIFQHHLKNKKLPKSYKEALQLTCKERNLGFFTVTSTMIWEMNKAENAKLKDNCRLRKMTDNAGILLSGIIYPKNSRFRGLIDYHLKNLQQKGIINRLQKKYWPDRHNLAKKKWESQNLENLSVVIHILLFGIISAFIMVILENTTKKWLQITSKKKRLRFLR